MRRVPQILLLLATVLAAASQDWHGFGPVAPVLLPDLEAERHDGERVRLRQVFAGRRSVVQFVFVDCPTACPLLGNLFHKVDRELDDPSAQLVTITVNPAADTPARLNEWRRQFHASSRWLALRLAESDLKVLLRAFQQDSGPPSGHTLQVFFVDSGTQYVGRTTAMPNADAIARQLNATLRPAAPKPAPVRAAAPAGGEDLFAGRGRIAPSTGGDFVAPETVRCAGCHGVTGEGGGEGKQRTPPIRGAELTAERRRRGGPPSRYTVESFCDSLRTGVDPAGVRFSDLMPRYALDGRSCRLLWDFLTN